MAEIFDSSRINIKKFDGKDFTLYRDKLVNILKASSCNVAIGHDYVLDGEGAQEKVAKDERAKFILMSTISDSILRRLPRSTANL